MYLDHVPGHSKGHVPQGQPPFFVNNLQHGVYVRVVQYQKASWILDRVAVFLQHGNTEAMKCIDVTRVVVPGEVVDTLAHLVGRLVGKGDAENVARHNTQLVHQKGKTVRQGPGLSGTGPGDDTHKAFRGAHGFPLGRIQFLHLQHTPIIMTPCCSGQIFHRFALQCQRFFILSHQMLQLIRFIGPAVDAQPGDAHGL